MLQRSFILLLGLFMFLPATAQKQKENTKSLKLFSPVSAYYPSISLSVENYIFTKPVTIDDVSISEDGVKTSAARIDIISSESKLNLYLYLINIDSLNAAEYVKSFSSLDQQRIVPYAVLFNDSAIIHGKPSVWCKNELHWRGIFDTTAFNKLSNKVLGLYHQPEDVFVLLTDNLNLALAKEVYLKIENSSERNPPYMMLLYRNIKSTEAEAIHKWADQFNIAVLPLSATKSDLSSVKTYLKSILNPAQIITWKSPKPLNLNTSRQVQITMKGRTAEMKIVIPDTLIKKYYTLQTISSVDSLSLIKEYQRSLKLLNDRYVNLKSAVFIEKAREILDDQLDILVNGKGKIPLSAFQKTESLNSIPLGKDYQQYKLKRIKELYNIIDKSDSLQSEQLRVAEYLVSVSPQDNDYSHKLHFSKAKLNDSRGNLLVALEEYRIAYKLKTDEKSKSAITRIANQSIRKFYQDKDWKNVKQYGQNYYDFIKQSFILMYYYGRSCYELAYYDVAIEQFKWLLFNWEDNKELSWDSAFEYLQNAYTFSFKFNDAVVMCQRIYSEKQDDKSLDLTILNLRLSWLKPVMDAFNIWLAKIPPNMQPEKFIALNRVMFPQYIGSVRLCGAKGETSGMLFENKNFANQPQTAPGNVGKSLIVKIENNTQWLISNTISGRSLVMLLNNSKLDEQEKNLMAFIKKEPTNNLVWEQLSKYEDKIGSRLLCQLYAEILASSSRLNGNSGAEEYLKILSENQSILYCVVHARDGTIAFQQGFDRSKAGYSDIDWKKSSIATTIYQIELKYGNYNVYDLTNPLYGNKGWEGALRIGIKRK